MTFLESDIPPLLIVTGLLQSFSKATSTARTVTAGFPLGYNSRAAILSVRCTGQMSKAFFVTFTEKVIASYPFASASFVQLALFSNLTFVSFDRFFLMIGVVW
jgi:hypothetical protein